MTSRIDDLIVAKRDDETLIIETLVDEFYGYIHRLAYSILYDPDDAEDAVQETFIIAYLKIDQYASGTNIKAWLSTIAVNICRNILRKNKRNNSRQNFWNVIQIMNGKDTNPEQEAIKSESDDQLYKAVNKLGDKHRLPLILRFVLGMSVREISNVLDLKPGTVHSRLHYGVRKLQKTIDEDQWVLDEIREVLP
jgi:RNA polymerase sigma-70 factor (ECF subfamily)